MQFQRIIYLLTLCLLFSCESVREVPDVSDVQIDFRLERLEQDMFNQSMEIAERNSFLKNKYGKFYFLLANEVLGLGNPKSTAILNGLAGFTSDKDILSVQQSINEEYNEFQDISDELKEAFTFYKYYFPDKLIPKIYTINGGFNYGVMVTDSAIGIGLEMFLGSDNEYYSLLRLPEFKKQLMTKKNIVPSVVKSWIETEFVIPENGNILETILHHGKIMYALDLILPYTPDSLKIGYSANKLQWCYENELNMWAHLVDKEMLYKRSQMDIIKLTSDAPFTSIFPQESPGRAGVWIGWQIIRKFMDENPDLTIQDLMNEKDAQLILAKSKYKPRK